MDLEMKMVQATVKETTERTKTVKSQINKFTERQRWRGDVDLSED